jgi:hypothetical protein
MMYMAAGIYFHLKYPKLLPFSVKAAYFTFGAAILLLINVRSAGIPLVYAQVVEIAAAVTFLIAWAFGISSVKTYVETTEGILHKLEDE